VKELHLYETLGRKVRDANGEYAGRLEEIEVERGEESCLVMSYLVQHRGLRSRITAWALSDSLQKAIPTSEKSLPYRVPWDLMDLSEPEHPRITVPKAELKRARSSARDGVAD
jgi:sporulation protein YlmC with PRC-barrel domain